MYHYLDDREFEHRMRRLAGKIMQSLCHRLKVEYDIGANFELVGSGGRNLILQNADEPVDLDYNLEILKCEDINNGRKLKEDIRKTFNEVLNEHRFGDCQDSTSCLTSPRIYFVRGNKTEFSIDVCITRQDEAGYYHRLIHKKTGCLDWDQYYWNIVPDSERIREKAADIKTHGKWAQLREEYLKIKNGYLSRSGHTVWLGNMYVNHPSFVCYIEAVNNVYNQIMQSGFRIML
ncbi:MAG: hypothetical protein MRZ73_07080 [Pseudoflavonifractor capillosus]|uniref:hypothetical protein n=1 Tax=Pseudoflavonifractor capillosus TaxID=106588 RepID=UPI0023FA3B7A|nr:hypothetical protein [Pseudoflavonifractor capillosus]MCI5928290.1 hypothetical protein [Pseudoflavonifractor capillosus]MDY4660230.1 hypothetical protein [Pseudoflavonifractor capillosus]